VLMAAAPEDRERPRLAESADLVGSAISIRLRRMRLPTAREYRHARLMLPVRIAIDRDQKLAGGLRPGLSLKVKVDVTQQTGPSFAQAGQTPAQYARRGVAR